MTEKTAFIIKLICFNYQKIMFQRENSYLIKVFRRF